MKFKRAKRGPVTETQMVSLADIAFLIIFFFMLSSSFMRDRAVVKLPNLPKSGTTESQLTVSMDEEGKISFEGQPVNDPIHLENLLKDKLGGKTKAEECEVRFKCDKTTPYKVYHPIYQAIANAGGVIAVMHEVK